MSKLAKQTLAPLWTLRLLLCKPVYGNNATKSEKVRICLSFQFLDKNIVDFSPSFPLKCWGNVCTTCSWWIKGNIKIPPMLLYRKHWSRCCLDSETCNKSLKLSTELSNRMSRRRYHLYNATWNEANLYKQFIWPLDNLKEHLLLFANVEKLIL